MEPSEMDQIPTQPPIAPSLPPRTRSSFARSNEDGGDYCRICRGEGTAEQPLFYPCKCSGSIKFVHQDCLMEWLSHSQKKYCELCKTPFRFTKLYDHTMPTNLPTPLFLRQLSLHTLHNLLRWARYLLVGLIWTCCLPWCIRQIWRGLFWLADGSWLSEEELRAALSRSSRTTTIVSQVTNLSALPTANTLPPPASTTAPLVSFLTKILKFLSGETLLAKILRFLFAVPPVLAPSVQQNRVNDPAGTSSTLSALPTSTERAPSLLSDVLAVKSLTSSTTLNNAFIDVFEGQFICIFLIAAFILVFLIREWVINQQPMLNMPEPDPNDNIVAPALPDNNARPPRQRRGPGIFPRPRAVPNPRVALGEPAAPARPIAIPHRRALTDDNIAMPARMDQERPDLPLRAASLIYDPANPLSANDLGLITVSPTDGYDSPDFSSDSLTPPPLTRGALGQAVDIQRTIQESGVPIDSHTDGHITAFDGTIEWDGTGEGRSSSASHSRRDSSVGLEPRVEHSNQETTSLMGGSASHAAGGSTGLSVDRAPSISDIDMMNDSESQQFDSNAEHENAGTTVNQRNAEAETETANIVDAADTDVTLLQKIANWLWQTEGQAPNNNVPTSDDVHIVADVHAEAPFVPVANGEIVPGAPNRQIPGQPAIPPPEPNIQFGIDLNDPNAIEEAEDLDGILELIGMEGPLAGMVQNVVFSLFLITLTLTASVWIPYIWGKIALLFLANPVIVFVKAPLYLLSRGADLVADVVLFTMGLSGYVLNHATKLLKLATAHFSPAVSAVLDTDYVERLTLNLTQSSGARLEKAIGGTFLSIRPDLPTFSMQSHHALALFKTRVSAVASSIIGIVTNAEVVLHPGSWSFAQGWQQLLLSVRRFSAFLPVAVTTLRKILSGKQALSFDLRMTSIHDLSVIDYALVEWSTQDKIIAIMLGYCFFGTAGVVYLKASHLFLGLRDDEKVEGTVADSLRQAGGVMKVIIIIGIEMIVFPLYCGFLLDIALLPLFESATLQTRLDFFARAPFTGLFIHWFVGTCYMFNFALFVSMCRKIMRKGVLYFIRDPDDPTFHPVRDVLERPVPNQLGKIAFSGLVYGGLVIMGMGGVVWTVNRVGGVLPIHWAAEEPRLAFPADVIFYNFMLPFILRKAEPSKKIAAVYEWWFRGCASGLRLTHFLFGEERESEKKAVQKPFVSNSATEQTESFDGRYVRAPASDSCRIPKGERVFLEVNENNERIDGLPDQDKGLHGKTDEKFAKIYIPSQFKARVASFIILLWIFAALTGATCTIGPLIVGRYLVKRATGTKTEPNDLYAITVGFHIFVAVAYAVAYYRPACAWLKHNARDLQTSTRSALPVVWSKTKHCAGLVYLLGTVGIILPFTLSLLSELYLHIPIFTALVSNPKVIEEVSTISPKRNPAIYVLQTWTLGLLYLRLALRLALTQPRPDTQAAVAIRAIVRNGYQNPDIKLASRAVILPATAACILLLGVPIAVAKFTITLLRVNDEAMQVNIYRYAYPDLLALGMVLVSVLSLRQKLAQWRIKIRDEVYLIGERLHNFQEPSTKLERSTSKGKEKVL